jgi:hypothetical protein
MKPALIAAVMLALVVNFAPRGKAQQRPGNVKEHTQADAYPDRQGPASSNNDESSAAKTETAKSETPHWYQSPEWVLVIVGIVTCFVIGWQSWATSRAAKATEMAAKATKESVELIIRKERAKISVQTDVFITQPVVMGGAQETFVTFKIYNFGLTKAIITSVEIGATVESSPEPNSLLDARVPTRLPPTMPPDAAWNCQATILPRQLDASDFQSVAGGGLFVRFFGSIKYRDVFDIERETAFYLRWEPFMTLRDYGSWKKMGPPEANREA